jgi:hypothetical protein
VTIDAPPMVTLPAPAPSGDEGSAIPISATASDDGTATSHWTVTSDAGNAAGSNCTIADPSSLSTSATCNDNGTFTLTLAVDDGVNATVTLHETLTIANVAPQLAHGVVSAGPHPEGQPVSVSWSFTDAGSNDTHTCSIDWGDGSPAGTGVIAGGTCTGTHSFASGGSFNSIVTITDDDGGFGSDGVTIPVDASPSVSAGGDVTGNEGELITLTGLVNDDHGATSLWTATAGAGVDAGATCAFGNTLSAVTTVSCTDDGTWTLTLTGDDGVNPPVSSTATLTLANVAPTLHITSATVAGGSTVSLTAAVADAGANDVLSCSIDWGDGAASVVAAVAGVCTDNHTYTGSGQRTITVTGSDDDGGSSAPASTTVTLNHPPNCSAVRTSLATLWPPNGKFVTVTLSGATDVDGDPLAYVINGVTQDEPVGGAPDAQRLGGGGLQLRAQRDGTGDGRVYIVSYSVSDGHLSCAGTVRITVVHDQAHAAVLSPRSYNSFG